MEGKLCVQPRGSSVDEKLGIGTREKRHQRRRTEREPSLRVLFEAEVIRNYVVARKIEFARSWKSSSRMDRIVGHCACFV